MKNIVFYFIIALVIFIRKLIIFLIFLVSALFFNYKVCVKKSNKLLKDKIIIDKINLEQYFYSENITNIDKNITLLDKSNVNDNMFILASHSGNSDISYFKNLDKLDIGDEINIIYDNKKIYYRVWKIEYIKKKIPYLLNKKENVLYLVTCDKYNFDKQIVFICKKMTKNQKN